MNMKWSVALLSVALMIVPLQGLSAVQPADSPWPLYCHDLKRTGRSSNPGPSAPVLLWSYRTGYELSEGPSPVIGSDGRLYMGSDDSTIYSLLPNGQLNWSYRALNFTGYPLALGSDGRVYIGAMGHLSGDLFYSMNSDGSLSWSYETGDSVFSGPAPGNTGRIYVGSVDRNLYAFDSDGSLYWSYQTGNWVNSSPALGNGEKIYVGSVDNNLYALDSDGSLYWSYETGKPIFSSPSILDGLERIYVGSDDNDIYTLDSGGSLYWSYTTTGGVKRSPSIGDDGETYAGSLDNRVYALNSSGTFRWSYETGDYIFSSPALDSDGRVYVGSNDNSLYAFTATGSLHWSFLTASDVGSAALGNAGQLYFASGNEDRNIYFLGADPGPTGSPTIMPTVTGTPTATASGTPAVTPTQAPTATPTPNYLELSVMANASGGYNFFPGEQVLLEWKTYEDRYGFKDVPCRIYLGAALDPLDEDTPVSVAQILSSGALFLFDSHLRPSRYTGGDIYPTYKNVSFPVPNRGSSGTIIFRVPEGAAGSWVFAAAFIRTDNRQFPSEPPVEVSNGFTLE